MFLTLHLILQDLRDGEELNVLAELQVLCTPRLNLSETSLSNRDLMLHVDGSASHDPSTGTNRVGLAVGPPSGLVPSLTAALHSSGGWFGLCTKTVSSLQVFQELSTCLCIDPLYNTRGVYISVCLGTTPPTEQHFCLSLS